MEKSNVEYSKMSQAGTAGMLAAPTSEILNERWINSLAQFELWTGIWSANPQLARSAGVRVEELMMPIEEVQHRYAKNW